MDHCNENYHSEKMFSCPFIGTTIPPSFREQSGSWRIRAQYRISSPTNKIPLFVEIDLENLTVLGRNVFFSNYYLN